MYDEFVINESVMQLLNEADELLDEAAFKDKVKKEAQYWKSELKDAKDAVKDMTSGAKPAIREFRKSIKGKSIKENLFDAVDKFYTKYQKQLSGWDPKWNGQSDPFDHYFGKK